MYENQARNSDRNSQAAMILGLLILTGAAVALLLVKSRSAQVVSGGLAVVGAAYSAYISKTFMTVRESALERHDRVLSEIVLENRFLDAERLIHDISSESQRQALIKEVFKARLEAIQSARHEHGRAADRLGRSPVRKAITARRSVRRSRNTGGNRLPVIAPQARQGRREAIEALLLTLGYPASLDEEVWTTGDDIDEEGPPAVER